MQINSQKKQETILEALSSISKAIGILKIFERASESLKAKTKKHFFSLLTSVS